MIVDRAAMASLDDQHWAVILVDIIEHDADRDEIENDRFPLSPRILTLKDIRAKLKPEPARAPLPESKHYEPPRACRRRA